MKRAVSEIMLILLSIGTMSISFSIMAAAKDLGTTDLTMQDGPYLSVDYPDGSHSKVFAYSPTPFEFTVNVTARDVDPGWWVTGVQFILTYNTSVLDALSVTQGTFFEPYTTTTFFFQEIFESLGKIRVAYTIFDIPGYTTPASGDGSIAIITFNVTFIPDFPECVWSNLRIGIDYEAGASRYFGYMNYAPPEEREEGPPVQGYYAMQARPFTMNLNVLNLGRKGVWNITAYIEMPDYNLSDVDVDSIRMNETLLIDHEVPPRIDDYDSDLIDDLRVQFNRTEISEFVLSKNVLFGNVKLTITGQFHNGTSFLLSNIIEVKMQGDINSDGTVNYQDAIAIGASFASKTGESNYDQGADENEDGYINFLDVILMGQNFGQSWT